MTKSESIFGSSLFFDQATDKIFYPQNILHQKLTKNDSALLQVLRQQADELLHLYP